MKRALSLFLSLVLVMGIVTSMPVNANAATNETKTGYIDNEDLPIKELPVFDGATICSINNGGNLTIYTVAKVNEEEGYIDYSFIVNDGESYKEVKCDDIVINNLPYQVEGWYISGTGDAPEFRYYNGKYYFLVVLNKGYWSDGVNGGLVTEYVYVETFDFEEFNYIGKRDDLDGYIEWAHTHTSSSWITDKKATVYSVGKKHKECTECGEILEIAKIAQLKCSKPKLKSIENTQYGVLVKWGKVNGADTYRVYRKTSKTDWEYIGSTSKAYYTDKTAKSGTKYYYAVRARNEAGNSSLSDSLSKFYLADPTLKTPSSTKKGVGLKWTKVTGAQGYMVYRKTSGGSYKRIATEKGVSNLTFRDTSAKKGVKYTYKVKAYYSKTYSAYSNTKTITDKY